MVGGPPEPRAVFEGSGGKKRVQAGQAPAGRRCEDAVPREGLVAVESVRLPAGKLLGGGLASPDYGGADKREKGAVAHRIMP
jgi:hypothetical protein